MIFALVYIHDDGTEFYEEYPKGIPKKQLDGYGLRNRCWRKEYQISDMYDDLCWMHFRRHQLNRASQLEMTILEQKRALLFESLEIDFIRNHLFLIKDFLVKDVLIFIAKISACFRPASFDGYFYIEHNLDPMTKVKRPAPLKFKRLEYHSINDGETITDDSLRLKEDESESERETDAKKVGIVNGCTIQ